MDFLDGVSCLAFAAVGLWFLRFWWDTRDRLLGLFAVAFGIFSVNRVLSAFVADGEGEADVALYAVRALAFALIIVAILDRNRRAER